MFLFKSKKKGPKPKTIKSVLEKNVEMEKTILSMKEYDAKCQEQEIEWFKDHIEKEKRLRDRRMDILDDVRKMIEPCERAIVLAEFIEKTTEELEKKKEESMSEEEYDAYLEKEIGKILEDMRAEEEEKKKKKKGIKTEPVVKPMERSPFGDLLECRSNLERTMDCIDKLSRSIGTLNRDIDEHIKSLDKDVGMLDDRRKSVDITLRWIDDDQDSIKKEDEFAALKKDVEGSLEKRK